MSNWSAILLLIVISSSVGWFAYDIISRLMKMVRPKKSKHGNPNSHTKAEETGGDFQGLYKTFRRFTPKNLKVNDAERERLEEELIRLGRTETVEEIKVSQYALLGILSLISLIILIFFKLFGIIGFVFAIYAYHYPISDIRKRIAKMNAAVEAEFPDFYRSIYFAYRKRTNVPLINIVRNCIKEASPEFAQELSILASNIVTLGEIEALRHWKRSLPLPYITRFSEYLEQRLMGENNVSIMEGFKTELDNARELARERQRITLEKRLSMVNGITLIPFILIALVYLVAQIQGSGFMETFSGK
jgi:Flp pilus assembly protein TadB